MLRLNKVVSQREEGVFTYITELQGEALCGLQLCCTQVHVFACRSELVLRGGFLLGLVHEWRQSEVEGAAGIIGLTHVDDSVTRNIFKSGTNFKQHLVVVLVNVYTSCEGKMNTFHTRTEQNNYLKLHLLQRS